MIETTQTDGVTVVRMDDGENRFNSAFVAELAGVLDEAADPGGPLVLTGIGKFFCNGLDLEWLGTAGPGEGGAMFRGLYGILTRLLRFPGATVAAINGHAFGAGVLLAAAADYRVQRTDRGYFCLPEVDLGMSMSDEFDAVLRAKFTTAAVLDALLTGRRYGGEEALAVGFVDAVATEDGLLDTAVGLVADLTTKDPAAVGGIKEQQHRTALTLLDAAS